MTAPYLECVAEEIQRPLISLTSADIGTDPESVEEELLSWFELARVWSAVLLLDVSGTQISV
jgi:hypothetical protein